jgi:uncharacterized protein YciI
MPQFVYTIKPTRADMLSAGLTEAEEAIIGAHFAYLSGLTEQGVVKMAGRTMTTGSESFGLVVFEAADEEAASAVMENDPAVKENVMRAEFHPFRIALFGAPPADI